jgi:cell division protease FtsH
VAAPRFLRPRVLALTAGILALSAIPTAIFYARRPAQQAPIAFSDFLKQVESGSVAAVVLDEHELRVTLRGGQTETTIAPAEFVRSNPAFVTDLVQRQIRVEVTPPPDPAALNYGVVATAIAFFGLLCFTVYRTTAGRIPSFSGRTRVAERGENVVTFQDVAGVDEAKDEVREIVDFLRDPARFETIGGRSRAACCSSGRPGRARRCSRGRSRARRACRSSSPAGRTSSRCTPASAPRACAVSSATRGAIPRASSSSTSWTRSDAAAAAPP